MTDTDHGTTRTTRAQRMAMPLAREVVRDLAVEHGACIRPVQLRRTNLDTGAVDQVLVPCGHTLASVCPACAERAKSLRAAQCREGWHLEDEPDITPDPATEDQQWWVVLRAEAQQHRDQPPRQPGRTPPTLTSSSPSWTRRSPRRASAAKSNPDRPARRHRSTRRRQDAPDLPRRKVTPRTVGKTYTAPDGKTFRPSLFVTLTCPSYGRVGEDGAPADPAPMTMTGPPGTRWPSPRCSTGSSRTCAATSATTCSTSPPSNPSGASPRTSTSPCAAPCPAPSSAASWPPPTTRSGGPPPRTVKYDGDELPVWDEATGNYLDPATGEVLPTWDQALDAIGDDDEPWHVARFGDRFDAQGVLVRIQGRRPVHRLPDQVPHQAGRPTATRPTPTPQQAHAARLAEALRYQPCSPRCANWLRYGIQPKNARPGLAPGRCKGKAHDADHLGYAGRRVLVSRKWSGKTLADHRADRKEWLLRTLGVSATDPARYAWEPVAPDRPGPHGPRAAAAARRRRPRPMASRTR